MMMMIMIMMVMMMIIMMVMMMMMIMMMMMMMIFEVSLSPTTPLAMAGHSKTCPQSTVFRTHIYI